jgi:serine O-acetyltransferase
MIKNKKDYQFYLNADLRARNFTKWKRSYKLKHPELYFQRVMRKLEYFNVKKANPYFKIRAYFMEKKFKKLGITLGFTIFPKNFEAGLKIAHYGSIVLHPQVRIGKNCVIHSSVNIGKHKNGVPQIGNNVYIAPGVKIFGGVTIGDNVIIGANSVINKDVPSNVVVAGVPAKVIRKIKINNKVIKGADIMRRELKQAL